MISARKRRVSEWFPECAVRAEPCGLLKPYFEGPGPALPFHSPISFSSSMHGAHIWKLARETLRRGRDLPLLTGATGRRSRAIAAIWDYEQREKIYDFIETRQRMFIFVAKMQSRGTEAFSGGALGRFGGEMAISGAFVLGRSATKVEELQSMAAACALTAWRPRETSDSPKDRRSRRETRFIGRVQTGKYSF